MPASAKISLTRRVVVFISLWLLASLSWAIFGDWAVEAGESQLAAQVRMVAFAPWMAAVGLAFVVVPGGYNAWPERQTWEGLVALLFLLAFAGHAIVMLTRTAPRQFLFWALVQVIALLASVVAVLYYWHWDALHMHG